MRVHSTLMLRASVGGHRTTKADIETLLAEVLDAGRQLVTR
ncbi:hypothetical protein ACWEHA_07235 [Amycolatopsis nivea]